MWKIVEKVLKLWENSWWCIGMKTHFQPVWANSHSSSLSFPQAAYCLHNDLIVIFIIIVIIIMIHAEFDLLYFCPSIVDSGSKS